MNNYVNKLSLIFLPLTLLGCKQENSQKLVHSHELHHLGKYVGDVDFYIDTLGSKTFATLKSSVSQVYKEDNSFDCTLFFLEDEDNVNDSLYSFSMLNMGNDTPLQCGKATLKVLNDSTIELSFSPIKENIGMCIQSIDFNATTVLTYQQNVGKSSNDNNDFRVKIIKVDKSYLYDSADESSITKGYLIKGDKVKVISVIGEWVRIRYSNINTKEIEKWIKITDIR